MLTWFYLHRKYTSTASKQANKQTNKQTNKQQSNHCRPPQGARGAGIFTDGGAGAELYVPPAARRRGRFIFF
jgi:hypothetical protein